MSYPPENDNPFAMSPDEVFGFLEERRFATVSTLRKTGAPLTIVLGYEWDGSSMFLSMRSTRAIVKRLERDPRVCITVHSNEYPPKYVIIEGVAEVVDDPGYVRSKKKALRYLAADSPAMKLGRALDLEEFWKNYFTVGRVCYVVRPQRLLSEDGAKWGDEAGAGAGASDAKALERSGKVPGPGR